MKEQSGSTLTDDLMANPFQVNIYKGSFVNIDTMNGHKLFNYIWGIEGTEYKSTLNGIEYYLKVDAPRSSYPQVSISYNDKRNPWGIEGPEDSTIEKDGEFVRYHRDDKSVCYHRIKDDVPSLLLPSFTHQVEGSYDLHHVPYPSEIEHLLDKALQLLQTAEKI